MKLEDDIHNDIQRLRIVDTLSQPCHEKDKVEDEPICKRNNLDHIKQKKKVNRRLFSNNRNCTTDCIQVEGLGDCEQFVRRAASFSVVVPKEERLTLSFDEPLSRTQSEEVVEPRSRDSSDADFTLSDLFGLSPNVAGCKQLRNGGLFGRGNTRPPSSHQVSSRSQNSFRRSLSAPLNEIFVDFYDHQALNAEEEEEEGPQRQTSSSIPIHNSSYSTSTNMMLSSSPINVSPARASRQMSSPAGSPSSMEIGSPYSPSLRRCPTHTSIQVEEETSSMTLSTPPRRLQISLPESPASGFHQYPHTTQNTPRNYSFEDPFSLICNRVSRSACNTPRSEDPDALQSFGVKRRAEADEPDNCSPKHDAQEDQDPARKAKALGSLPSLPLLFEAKSPSAWFSPSLNRRTKVGRRRRLTRSSRSGSFCQDSPKSGKTSPHLWSPSKASRSGIRRTLSGSKPILAKERRRLRRGTSFKKSQSTICRRRGATMVPLECKRLKQQHSCRSDGAQSSQDILSELQEYRSPACCLPLVRNDKKPECNTISADTLVALVNGKYDEKFDEYVIVDCRFEYEYEGGHIKNAINFPTPRPCEEVFMNSDLKNKRVAIVFHCEFSSKRGPDAYKYLRGLDRAANTWPNLSFPDIYLLKEGYKNFHTQYQEYCTPQGYVNMLDPKFNKECKLGQKGLKHFVWNRRRSRSVDSIMPLRPSPRIPEL